MSRLLALLLSLVYGVPVFAQPLREGTEVTIETKGKTIRGVLEKSSDMQWLRVVEPGAQVPTLIPIIAIDTVRPKQPAGAPKHAEAVAPPVADRRLEPEAPGAHVDKPPLEITVSVAADGPPTAWIKLKANAKIEPTFLEIALLGVAGTNGLDGLVKSAPRRKQLLGLPAVISYVKPLPAFAIGEERTVTVPLKLEPATGRGGVIATIGTALPAQGEPGTVGPLGILESGYVVFAAENGKLESGGTFLDVEIKRLRRRGALADEEPNGSEDDAIERLKRSGSRSLKRLRAPAPDERAAARADEPATDVRVKGSVRFTDIVGGTHPVPFVKVELWDSNAVGAHLKLADGETDGAGNYSLAGTGTPGDRPDLFVIARAIGKTVKVTEFNSNAVWAIDSLPAINDVPAGAELQIDLIAENDLINKPNNVAFEIYAAVDVMARYVESIGQPLPRQVTVQYPRAGDSSDYLGDTIRLGGTDAHDWDNIQHEFGHHLQAVFGISNSPGGGHSLDENLCESRGKSNGIRLAWGEGWPTFFSILMQTERGLQSMNVPNVGDTRYTDEKPDGSSLEYDIEGSLGSDGAGEGNEIAVQRVLWDLYDSSGGEQEQVAIGAAELFGITVAARCVSFSDFFNALVATRPAEGPEFGSLLATHRIAPAPQSPSDGVVYSGGQAPTFTWTGETGCQLTANIFEVVIFTDDFSTPRFTSGPLNTTSFTPTEAQRLQIFGGTNGTLRWLVRVQDPTPPATGQYFGRSRTIVDNFDVQ